MTQSIKATERNGNRKKEYGTKDQMDWRSKCLHPERRSANLSSWNSRGCPVWPINMSRKKCSGTLICVHKVGTRTNAWPPRINLAYFKVPQAGIESIRSKLAFKIFDEYANIRKGMYSTRGIPGFYRYFSFLHHPHVCMSLSAHTHCLTSTGRQGSMSWFNVVKNNRSSSSRRHGARNLGLAIWIPSPVECPYIFFSKIPFQKRCICSGWER